MVGLRLFLPETWTGDEACSSAPACLPNMLGAGQVEIALAELDRLIAAGVRFLDSPC